MNKREMNELLNILSEIISLFENGTPSIHRLGDVRKHIEALRIELMIE